MKKLFTTVIVILLIIMSGCAKIDGFLVSKIEERADIETDARYKEYSAYTENGNLDSSGYYIESEMDDPEQVLRHNNGTKVSLARNGYLDVKYYKDALFYEEVNSQYVYLGVNDCLFASVTVSNAAPSTAYCFAGFRLSEADENGEINELSVLMPDDNSLVFQLADEYVGKDLVLVPLGTYETKQVSVTASYFDNNDVEHPLAGKWVVNDKPVVGSKAEVSPVSSYITSFEFDPYEYFFLSSEPQCFYCSNEDGLIIFNKCEPTDEVSTYSVQLHQFVNTDLPSNTQRVVSVNNGSEQKVFAGSSLHISRLKYGDTIVILTDSAWNELENSRDLVLQSKEDWSKDDQWRYKYTLIVPQKDGRFEFDPSEYSYEHGSITFKCFGEEVTSVQYLAEGNKITYEQRSAESGYWLGEGNHVIVVSTPEKTRAELQSIRFVEKVRVKVSLDQPKSGGRIEYYVNGTLIRDNEYYGDSGTVIKMKFIPWEGWHCEHKNEDKYTVTAEANQRIIIDEPGLPSFSEDEAHKPVIQVNVDKSVGVDAHIVVTGANYNETISGSTPKGKNKSTTHIGTEDQITVDAESIPIMAGTAVKVEVKLSGEDKSGGTLQKITSTYCRLAASLTEMPLKFDIYDADSKGSSTVWYDKIEISISVVDVQKLTLPANPQNGTIIVRNQETSELLKDGDILEGSQKVTVSIVAKTGYYVGGKDSSGDVFRTTVKFSKCVSDLQKMVNDHPIEKYIRVTLSSVDPFGECVYTYGGKTVSGTIDVRQGDKIELSYKVTDQNYMISNAGFLSSKTEAKKSITINQLYDGRTISRESFGITIAKR